MTSLPDWLHQRALVSPDRLAVVAGGERLSFKELDERVGGAAGWLRSLGIVEGDRVAVLLRNGLPFLLLVHALARLGVVLVPINTRLTANEVGWQLKDVQTRLLICDQLNVGLAQAAIQTVADVHVVAVEELTYDSEVTPSLFDLESPHSILYTSGTTGQPKGAVLTFGNHWWSAIGSALNLGVHLDDRWLACMPLFHVGGLAILLRSVIYGNAVVVHSGFEAADVNRAFDDDSISIVSMVATMLQRTLDERGARPFPKSLRCILLGGGPTPKSLLEECARRHVPVMQTYGLTEAASQVATLSPEDALRKLGSAGKPLLPNELRIQDDEIIIRGPTVMSGYWEKPEASERVLKDGWLYTGDLGYLDDEGYLYILDRRDDLIISGGENVYPAEIEGVLRSHPAVADAGVAGVLDEEWGRVPIAFVVRRDDSVNEETLQSFCSGHLARYKVPKRISFVESLPRNAGGKLLRRELLSIRLYSK